MTDIEQLQAEIRGLRVQLNIHLIKLKTQIALVQWLGGSIMAGVFLWLVLRSFSHG